MHPGPNPSADHRDRTPAGQAGGRGAAPGREVLAGLVERVTFHNPETGFCVLRLKARGHRDLVTAVGHAAMISAGEGITASGEWTNDRTHGRQFRVRFLKASAPSSVEGIEKYLGSGLQRQAVHLFDVKGCVVVNQAAAEFQQRTGHPPAGNHVELGWAVDALVLKPIAGVAARQTAQRE